MNSPDSLPSGRTEDKRLHPFRRAILRGLAVVLPPLLTIVIFLWVWNTITDYVLVPVENMFAEVMMQTRFNQEIFETHPDPDGSTGMEYVQLDTGEYIPRLYYDTVRKSPGGEVMPNTPDGVMHRYIAIKYLKWYYVGPIFLVTLIAILYMLGRFLAAGVGRMLWNGFDRVLHQLPIVRNVYGSVKQVTDFVFSEREIEFTRVVAVEYPRKGIWSLGFVTGESMLDIRGAANEPIISVLMPTSPMPATGFTVNVKKSETIDLNITMDQAFQFIVSCGVVVPAQQMVKMADSQEAAQALLGVGDNGDAEGDGPRVSAASEEDKQP